MKVQAGIVAGVAVASAVGSVLVALAAGVLGFLLQDSVALVGAIVVVAALVLAVVGVRTASATTVKRIRIGLAGLAGVGKTVYVSVLFGELSRGALGERLNFAVAEGTPGAVDDSISVRVEPHNLLKTPRGNLYLYAGNIRTVARSFQQRLFGSREYRIDIADVAGEELYSFPYPETAYTRFATSSDAILLLVDYPALFGGSSHVTGRLSDHVDLLSRLLDVTYATTGTRRGRRLKLPVALVITKCDLAPEFAVDPQVAAAHVISKVRDSEARNLITLAETHCRWFEIFAVSALGPLPDGPSAPPALRYADIEPFNVTAPLLWILEEKYDV